MGLKGQFDRNRQDFILIENEKLRNHRNHDDILIDQLGGILPDPSSWLLTAEQARLLAGVYKRGDKELAHLTGTFNEEFNKDEVVDDAAQLIEKMLNTYLYTVVREKMPEIVT